MGKVLGVVAGLVAMFVISIAILMIGPMLHPVPTGMELREAMATWNATAPLSVRILTVVAWLLSTLAGSWVALRISRWAPGAWIVAVLSAASALSQAVRNDYPLWMQVAAVVAPLLGGWLAIRLARPSAADPISG